jgi:hypothetical protein
MATTSGQQLDEGGGVDIIKSFVGEAVPPHP